MEIHLAPDQQAVVEDLIRTGRFATVDAAISEGVKLLIAHEELRRQVQIGIDQADRGELIDHESVFRQLRAIAIGENSVDA